MNSVYPNVPRMQNLSIAPVAALSHESIIDQYMADMRANGVAVSERITADGKRHRCHVEGDKPGSKNGWYVLHIDDRPAGIYGSWKMPGERFRWSVKGSTKLTPAERAKLHEAARHRRAETEKRNAIKHQAAAERAEEIFQAGGPVISHPYLVAKGVEPSEHLRVGAWHWVDEKTGKSRLVSDCALLVKMRDVHGKIHSVQAIIPDEREPNGFRKQYLKGGAKEGHYFTIGRPVDNVVLVCEGLATGLSLNQCTRHAVLVAFDAGNLSRVAQAFHAEWPRFRLVICADNDAWTPRNTGLIAAGETAIAVNGVVAEPRFLNTDTKPTDFNDLHQLEGQQAVLDIVKLALASQLDARVSATSASKNSPVAATVPPVPQRDGDRRSSTVSEGSRAVLVRASEIVPEAIRWIWRDWIAAGKLHVLAGSPGTGKTTLALRIAAIVSRGGEWPDGTRPPAGDVLMWSSEDDPKDTLVPRLIAMGADLNRVQIISACIDDVTREKKPFDPAKDMPALRATIEEQRIKPALLIIDPIVSAVSGDSNKSSETRRALQPLVDLGVDLGCAVLGISHFSKGTQGKNTVERVTGSLAFAALARIVLVAAKMSEDQGGGHFVARAKSNIGPDGGGYRYEIQQIGLPERPEIVASIVSLGEPIDGDARAILAEAEAVEVSNPRNQTDQAEDWLRKTLADGPMRSKDLIAKATAEGISQKSLRRARERTGAKGKRHGFENGRWE